MTDVPWLKSDLLPPAAFAAACAAALTLGWMDWTRTRLAPAAPTPAVRAQGDAAAARSAAVARKSELAQWPLFGAVETVPAETQTPPAPAVIDEAALPDSTAPYQLFGIIEAEVQSAARAILGSADGAQREYRVGDTMPDGARVHAVRERAVIFDRNAQLERLSLPEIDGASAPFANNRPPEAGVRGLPPRPYESPAMDAAPVPEHVPMPPTDVPPPVEVSSEIPPASP